MPYIKENDRSFVTPVLDSNLENPGELNYAITCIVIKYIKKKGLSYQAINDVVGALEGAKLEFYRRVAAPYEDSKITENGDVY